MKLTYFFIMNAIGILVFSQGCSLLKPKEDGSTNPSRDSSLNPGESTQFRSANVALVAPTEAEVATDMTDLAPANSEAPSNAGEDPAHQPQISQSGTTNEPNQQSQGTMSYVVANGDTLMKISFKAFADPFRWREILDDNKDQIKNPNLLSRGSKLVLRTSAFAEIIKNGTSYFIKRQDTLGKISNSLYGSPTLWPTLWKNNLQLIKDPNKIYAGFTLYFVPAEEVRKLASTPEKK